MSAIGGTIETHESRIYPSHLTPWWPDCAGGIPYAQPRLVADLVPRFPRGGEAADTVTRRAAAMGTDDPRSGIIPAVGRQGE
jgi:hypothetical protein